MMSLVRQLSLFSSMLFHMCTSDVLTQIGRFYIQDIGFPGAENIAIDTHNNRIFTADGSSIAVNVLSYTLSDDLSSSIITLEKTITFDTSFTEATQDRNTSLVDVTSVAYCPNRYILAALVPDDYAIKYGWLAFINPTNLSISHLLEIDLCYLPDHITVTDDGFTVIIACEGEPDDNEIEYPTYNPPGSVAIIDISSDNMDDWIIHNVNFKRFDSDEYQDLMNNVYITHQNVAFSINVEPEYSALSDDNKYGYICLQEQNAIAVLDIDAKEIIDIYPLGFNDYSVYGLDASDKDGEINIETYPNLYGMRAPDSIAYLLSDDRHYIFTANEGDSKDFDEVRVKDIILSNRTFGDYNISDLQKKENLGRLKVTNLYGKNELNEYETLYTFSSRDFTIWEVIFDDDDKPKDLELIYSSNNIFESVTADVLGFDGFNSDYFHPSFDERSDAKGPEPESIAIATCNNGRKYVFIGMERVGGIFVFDISLIDEGVIEYIFYLNLQNYSVEWMKGTRPPEIAGDIGGEQMRFIDESVYGAPLLIVAYPESSSVAMFRIDCGEEIPSNTPSISHSVFLKTGAIVAAMTGICFMLSALGWFVRYKCKHNDDGNSEKGSDQVQKTTLMFNSIQNEVEVDADDIGLDRDTIGWFGINSNNEQNEIQQKSLMNRE